MELTREKARGDAGRRTRRRAQTAAKRGLDGRRENLQAAGPVAFSLLFLLVLLCAGTALACPSCKTTDASSKNPAAEARLTRGWARSIYLLMWTPYLLFGGVTFAIIRSARRNKEKIS
ncbi:MAG: hypothetical protein Q7J69_01285 [Candidatus Omnitrophota bacterium]|nr:hypothetical protein [Candidatus Omnitrophota bacterium]